MAFSARFLYITCIFIHYIYTSTAYLSTSYGQLGCLPRIFWHFYHFCVHQPWTFYRYSFNEITFSVYSDTTPCLFLVNLWHNATVRRQLFCKNAISGYIAIDICHRFSRRFFFIFPMDFYVLPQIFYCFSVDFLYKYLLIWCMQKPWKPCGRRDWGYTHFIKEIIIDIRYWYSMLLCRPCVLRPVRSQMPYLSANLS